MQNIFMLVLHMKRKICRRLLSDLGLLMTILVLCLWFCLEPFRIPEHRFCSGYNSFSNYTLHRYWYSNRRRFTHISRFPLFRYPLDETKFLLGIFPEDFVWGVATSAYQVRFLIRWQCSSTLIVYVQVEGAWNEGGKGVSIWDTYSHHNVPKTIDGLTADVACDSYHLYKEDVKIIKDMGMTHYRFSIAWTRILPQGNSSSSQSTLSLNMQLFQGWAR